MISNPSAPLHESELSQPTSSLTTKTPALSVIMPAYNAGSYLRPAIESILNQTWKDFEFIIIDDGSTDGTREIIEDYAARDPRIRSCPNERNMGVTRTLNRAISLVRADWIARMDADDLSLPHRLEKQMKVVRENPRVGLVTSPFDLIDSQNRRKPGWRGICYQRETLPFFLLFYNRLNAHGQVIYSTKLVRQLGGYREQYHLSEATELWLRMVRATRSAIVPEPLYLWRVDNPNSVTKQNKFRYADGSLLACREEIERSCGLHVSREQMILLRDFWLRYPLTPAESREADELLTEIARRFRPEQPVSSWSRRVAVALGCAWLSHAVLQAKRRRMGEALEHFGRSARAAKWWLPLAMGQFTWESVAVGGQLSRRA